MRTLVKGPVAQGLLVLLLLPQALLGRQPALLLPESGSPGQPAASGKVREVAGEHACHLRVLSRPCIRAGEPMHHAWLLAACTACSPSHPAEQGWMVGLTLGSAAHILAAPHVLAAWPRLTELSRVYLQLCLHSCKLCLCVRRGSWL